MNVLREAWDASSPAARFAISCGCVAGAGMLYVVVSGLFTTTSTPPGDRGYPIVGCTFEYLANPHEFVRKRSEKYGPIFKSHIFFRPTIFLTTCEDVRYGLSQEKRGKVNAGWPYYIRKIVGEDAFGIISDRDHHARWRTLTTRFMSMQNVEPFWNDMKVEIDAQVDKWCSQGTIDLYHQCASLILTLSIKFLCGNTLSIDEVKQFKHEMELWVQTLKGGLPLEIPGTAFHQGMKSKRVMTGLMKKAIDRRRNQEQELERIDLLQRILNDGTFHDKEICESLVNVAFASHETTSTAICGAIHLLDEHPDIREKLSIEIEEALGESQVLDFAAVMKMKYLNCFYREMLRYLAMFHEAQREIIEPFEYKGYSFPKGWFVALSFRQVMLSKDEWKFNPEEFNPDRFLSKIKPSTNLPFGGGSHICPGMFLAQVELKYLIVLVLRNYTFEIQHTRLDSEFLIRQILVDVQFRHK